MSDDFALTPFELSSADAELVQLYLRFVSIQKKLIKLNAELDNVRELIRQKGL